MCSRPKSAQRCQGLQRKPGTRARASAVHASPIAHACSPTPTCGTLEPVRCHKFNFYPSAFFSLLPVVTFGGGRGGPPLRTCCGAGLRRWEDAVW